VKETVSKEELLNCTSQLCPVHTTTDSTALQTNARHLMQVSHIISCRAPVVATWADRFSWCCWWWFSQFFTCPI